MPKLEIIDILIGISVAQQNLAAHWFPWSAFEFLVDEKGMLKRVLAYIHGVLTILVGATVAMTFTATNPYVVMWWMAVMAGLGTLLGYGVDLFKERQIHQQDAEIIEEMM